MLRPGQVIIIDEPWQNRVRIIPAGAEESDDEYEIAGNYPDWNSRSPSPIDPEAVDNMLRRQMDDDSPVPPHINCVQDADQEAALDAICDTCVELVVNTANIPCGHAYWCYGCARREFEHNPKCPICREPVTDILHLRGNARRNNPPTENRPPSRIQRPRQQLLEPRILMSRGTQTEPVLSTFSFQQNAEAQMKLRERKDDDKEEPQ
jgi:hypothetical protein